jgi:hypothetical protein
MPALFRVGATCIGRRSFPIQARHIVQSLPVKVIVGLSTAKGPRMDKLCILAVVAGCNAKQGHQKSFDT